MEATINVFAALDVSRNRTAICVVDGARTVFAEARLRTCSGETSAWLAGQPGHMERIGEETGPLSVWLWNALPERGRPIVCLDAHHANAC